MTVVGEWGIISEMIRAFAPLVIDWMETLRRLALVLSLCFWLGGFTFYALVVIHTGHRVFGSRVEVGFLTQAVTRWLNLSSVPTLFLMLWEVLLAFKRRGGLVRFVLAPMWVVVVGIEVTLFVLHPRLDTLLDPGSRSIVDRRAFGSLHLLYMNLSTAQWVATLIFVLAVLRAWLKRDRGVSAVRFSDLSEGRSPHASADGVPAGLPPRAAEERRSRGC